MDYTGFYADCYILAAERTSEMINRFLDEFLPNREAATGIYELPQHGGQTEREFDSVAALIKFLVKETSTPYAIYWSNLENSDLKNAMCFFTDDHCSILGLSCDTPEKGTKVEDQLFERLKAFGKTSIGYVTYECPAPTNSKEFRRLCH